jgi:hypothetical protein
MLRPPRDQSPSGGRPIHGGGYEALLVGHAGHEEIDGTLLDRGPQADALALGGRGIIAHVARRGIESSRRLGRHRWVVERTVSWPAGCRRLRRRYERRADHFAFFVAIAAALVYYRRLAK